MAETEATKDGLETALAMESTKPGPEQEETKQQSTQRHEKFEIQSNFRIIDTKLDIMDLSEIDTASRTFRCRVKVTMTWKFTEEQKTEIENLKWDDQKLNQYLSALKSPLIDPWNARDIDVMFQIDPEVEGPVEISLGSDYNFCCTQVLKGHWQMDPDDNELNDFPFDYVKLPIYLYTNAKNRFKINIDAENAYTQKSVLCRPSVSQEFYCYLADIETICVSNDTRQIYDAGICIQIHAVRKWRYYFNQVAIFIFFLSLMVLPGYSIHVRQVSNRISHFVTLLLAQTALLYFVGGSLPKLSYFSILDEYLIWNFILTLGCGLQSALMNLFNDDEMAEDIDSYCFWVVCASFFMINAFYALGSYKTAQKNGKKKYTERLKIKQNPDYFVRSDSTKSVHDGGVCVYHSHDWSDLCEYRDWRKKSKEFEFGKIVILDKVVVLFDHSDVPRFLEQNSQPTI